MKYKLSKTEFEALSDEAKKEYTLDGESAVLKIEGDGAPTTEEITRLKEKQLISDKYRKEAEKARDDAEKREEKLKKDLDGAGGKEAIEKINAAHQEELDKIRGDRAAEQTAAKEARDSGLKRETAEAFANERFTIPGLISDQFAKRLSVEDVGGTPVIRVLDAEGKASALSLDEYKREFLDNESYSSIIKADVGGGGGAAPGGGGGGASQKKIAEMTLAEQANFEREDPKGFEAALASEKA